MPLLLIQLLTFSAVFFLVLVVGRLWGMHRNLAKSASGHSPAGQGWNNGTEAMGVWLAPLLGHVFPKCEQKIERQLLAAALGPRWSASNIIGRQGMVAGDGLEAALGRQRPQLLLKLCALADRMRNTIKDIGKTTSRLHTYAHRRRQ